jgi:cephalosporin hydroxylase
MVENSPRDTRKRVMKLVINTDSKTLTEEINGEISEFPLYSKEAFEIISRQWLKVGWNQKYPYTFTWMGRPIIQLPEDMIRTQEALYRVKPDVLIETGVAHGGSLIYYAGLFKAMGRGRVIGVDVEIRQHNRAAIESHELAPYITLIEGSSIADDVLKKVKALIRPDERVMVILDSNHSKAHVGAELSAYHALVSVDSYIVATDGSMIDLHDVPRGKAEWVWDNPMSAAAEFAKNHPQFLLANPEWGFNESDLNKNITHWPGAWLKRISN